MAPCIEAVQPEPEPIITVGPFEAIPGSSPIGIMDLGILTCRWPIGDPHEPGFGYCGRSSSPYGYCAHHHGLGHRLTWPREVAA
jgi:GcrA cell cycle regulator